MAFARKGLLRLAEKNALRPSAGLIWDPIRAMLVGHSINELIEADVVINVSCQWIFLVDDRGRSISEFCRYQRFVSGCFSGRFMIY